MTFEQLEIFLAVSKQLHFTDAAAELYMSQSSVSKQIKKLEAELGAMLFVRQGRGIELTEAGKMLIESSKILCGEFQAVKKRIASYTENRIECITVLGEPVLASYGIYDFIDEFIGDSPNLRLQYSECLHGEMPDMSNAKCADLLLIYEEHYKANIGEVIRLLEDEVVLVVSKDHPLSARTSLNVSELKNECFSVLHDTMLYTLTLELCKLGRFSPNIRYKICSTTSQFELISQGKAVGFVVGERAFACSNPNTKIIRIEHSPRCHVMAVLPYSSDNSNSNQVIEYLKKRMSCQNYSFARCV